MTIGTEEPERTLGVAGLAIWDAVMVRVVRVIRSGIIIANTSNLEIISIPSLCLATRMPIAILSAAFDTFRGKDSSRVSLLVC
jgi:hypothetical protein